jgi:hypothetical protein
MPNKVVAPDASRMWSLYQIGVTYKSTINLYDTVTRNERFYVGDQWGGANTSLPKPVINFIKRSCQQKVANTASSRIKTLFTAPNWPKEVVTSETENAINTASLNTLNAAKNGTKLPDSPYVSSAESTVLSGMFENDWAKLNMDYINQCGLLDACISGDYILYNYWDNKEETGQASKGMIGVETIDNVNYLPNDVNERDPQKQPGMIIARRELVESVISQAKVNGVKDVDLEAIRDDKDYIYQSGDMSKYELDDKENGKCITLLYLWRDLDSGKIFAQKSVKGMIIRKMWDTKLTRYPISIMNWELRKNSCHGRAEVTGLVPNQVAVNKVYAYAILYILQLGMPKVIYSTSAGIRKWDNDLSKPIAVNGDINAAAKYLQPASMPNDAYALPDKLMRATLEMMGSNDVSMGNVNPVNSSAFLMAKTQAEVPIENIRQRFYAFVREFARNWLDMEINYIDVKRYITLADDHSHEYPAIFDPEKVKGKLWSVKIDIGPTKDFVDNSMENLAKSLQSGQIDFLTFLKFAPNNYFENKAEMIDLIEKMQAKQAAQTQQQTLEQIKAKQATPPPMFQPPQQPQSQQMGGVQNG